MSFKTPVPSWLIDLETRYRLDREAWRLLTGSTKATGEMGKIWRAAHRQWRAARGYSFPKSAMESLAHLRIGCFNADACKKTGSEASCPAHLLFGQFPQTPPEDRPVKAPPKRRGLKDDAMKDLRAQLRETRRTFEKIKRLADEIARVLQSTSGADK